jgi:hypothetical protein
MLLRLVPRFFPQLLGTGWISPPRSIIARRGRGPCKRMRPRIEEARRSEHGQGSNCYSESNAVKRKKPSPSINYILDSEDIMKQSGLEGRLASTLYVVTSYKGPRYVISQARLNNATQTLG